MKLNKTRHVLAVPDLKISSAFIKTNLAFQLTGKMKTGAFYTEIVFM